MYFIVLIQQGFITSTTEGRRKEWCLTKKPQLELIKLWECLSNVSDYKEYSEFQNSESSGSSNTHCVISKKSLTWQVVYLVTEEVAYQRGHSETKLLSSRMRHGTSPLTIGKMLLLKIWWKKTHDKRKCLPEPLVEKKGGDQRGHEEEA